MGAFSERIAEDVVRQLSGSRYQSLARHGLSQYRPVAGRVFFVMATSATNYTQFVEDHPDYRSSDGVVTAAAVYNTIDAAVGACTANQGDVIFVSPNYTETVSAAAGLDLDVAGISVIGLGNGDNRPVVNFTTATTADVDVDAANILVENIRFTGGFDALVAPLDVNAADFSLINCQYRDVTGQCTDFLLADNAANRMRVIGLVYQGDSVAGTDSGIAIVGADQVEIGYLYMDGNFAVGGIDIRTTAVVDLWVHHFTFRTRNNADIFIIDTITGSTGMIENGFIRLQQNEANITEAITGATFVLSDNIWVVNLANEKAVLINWVASTDA